MIDSFCFADCRNLGTVTCGGEWKVLRLKADGPPIIERQREFWLTEISPASEAMSGCLHLY
jgi:hypothetical protein